MAKRPHKVWSAVSRTVLCRTPYVAVRRDRVVFPDRKIRPYLVMERHDFAVVIPRFSNRDMVLVRQYRYPLGKYTWEFPMGVVRGVSMLKAAMMELQQETGYRARRWKFLGRYHMAPGLTNQKACIYLAEDLVPGDAAPEDGEYVTSRRISQRILGKWIAKRRIKDGPTLVAWSYLTG